MTGVRPAFRYIGKAVARTLGAGELIATPTAAQARAAKITPAQAFNGCTRKDSPHVCDKDVVPTIELASATVPNSGTAAANGDLIPVAKNRLSYLIEWDGEPCVPSHTAPAAGQTLPSSYYDTVYACNDYLFIDAVIGNAYSSLSQFTPRVLSTTG